MRTNGCLALLLWVGCGGGDTPVEAAPEALANEDPAAMLSAAASLEAAGDLGAALARAEAALAAGGGRDAALSVAKLAIRSEQYDRALTVLQPLVDVDPNDSTAQYDLALVHHRRNDYNRARSGYLAALRADPQQADARFNLALLCWNQGVQEEARHHAAKFREAFPTDVRGHELASMMSASSRPAAEPGPRAAAPSDLTTSRGRTSPPR